MKALFMTFNTLVKDYNGHFHSDFVRIKEYYNLLLSHYKNIDFINVSKEGNNLFE